MDLTECKKAHEQIKASLKEKEILLQEIHHRIKNNMQIISSLLRLPSKYIKEKKYRILFEESQNDINKSVITSRINIRDVSLGIDFAIKFKGVN